MKVRFSRTGAFAKRKDINDDEPRELVVGIPKGSEVHFTYEVLRVDQSHLAGWDQTRGAWYVPVDENGDPALAFDSDQVLAELGFSDVEFLP